MIDQPWTKSPQDILAHFGTDPANGLNEHQAAEHVRKYGKNGAYPSSTQMSAYAHGK